MNSISQQKNVLKILAREMRPCLTATIFLGDDLVWHEISAFSKFLEPSRVWLNYESSLSKFLLAHWEMSVKLHVSPESCQSSDLKYDEQSLNSLADSIPPPSLDHYSNRLIGRTY